MKKILSILMALALTITLSAQKTQYYDLIIQKTIPLLHLYGSGGIINWNNGDVLFTHSSNAVTVSGGDFLLGTTYSLGIGTTAPLHKLVVVNAAANNLNAFNFVNSDINKNRSTTAQAIDTSSVNLKFSTTGSPSLNLTNKAGVNLLSVDSAKITTPNEIVLTGNNVLTLSGSATVWDDLMFPFQTGSAGSGIYPPYVADSSYFAFVVDSTGGTKCFMYFIVQMPHKMKIGSTIYPHVHYKQEDATTDTPIFIMKYKWYDLGGTTQKGFKWYRMATSTGTTDKTHQLMYNASGGIPGTGITSVSSILVCEVYLYALAAGNAACNAYQFDIHYEIDGLGSRSDLAK